jgi:hypothetical protein
MIMWIQREMFSKLIADKAKAEGAAQILAQRVVQQDATIDWMKTRLTQLEYERAQLINNYMGVKIPIPEFDRETTAKAPRVTAEDVLNQTVAFIDVGDEEAAKLGLSWDDEGRLMHNGKLAQQ